MHSMPIFQQHSKLPHHMLLSDVLGNIEVNIPIKIFVPNVIQYR